MDGTTDAAMNEIFEKVAAFYSAAYSDLLVTISVVFVIIGLVFVAFPIVIAMMQNRNFDRAIKSRVDNSESRLKKNIEGARERLWVEVRKGIDKTQEELTDAQENLRSELKAAADKTQEELTDAQENLRSELKAAAAKAQKELKEAIYRTSATAQGGIFHVQASGEYKNNQFVSSLYQVGTKFRQYFLSSRTGKESYEATKNISPDLAAIWY